MYDQTNIKVQAHVCAAASPTVTFFGLEVELVDLDATLNSAMSSLAVPSEEGCWEIYCKRLNTGSITNGNSKTIISTGSDGVIRILPSVQLQKFKAGCQGKEAKATLIRVSLVFNCALQYFALSTSSTNIPEKEFLLVFADEVHYSRFSNNQKTDYASMKPGTNDDVDTTKKMDINWPDSNACYSNEEVYKKTGRRVRVDGKTPVGFDKKKLECFNCHNTGHFARECTTKGTHDGKKKRDSFYQHQEAGKQEKNQMGLLTMDDGIVNWGEHTEDEETNHALMAISSSSEVSLCSKTCIDSYNTLKTLCDEQMNQLGDQEAQILAYSQAVKKLEAQLVTFQKQQLSLNEKLTFQANEIYEKDEKLKKYRRIGMKAVKEKEQLQKTLDSWKDSSKNLWRLINSGMSSNSKVGLGYEIQSNNEVLSYEEEMNFSVFNCSEEDSVGKPLYSRFIKTNDFKGVPHPLSGDYTPKPQEEIDESLYVYGKKGPQEPEPSVSDDRSSEYSTCQSNDSAGSIGTSSEHSVDPESEISRVPQEVYVSKPITTNEKGVSAPKSKEVEPSCVTHIKTPRQSIKDQETPNVNRKNWNAMMERELGEGYSFTKKKCFVCGSLSHLIKDCDYYEKKMAREAEFKKQRVFNTGNRVAKPVWTNANRVNHANQFVPKPVQLNAGRAKINSVRPNINTGRAKINSVRPNINTGRTNVNSVRPRVSTVSSNVNTVRSRQPVPTRTSNSFSPKRPQVNQFNQRRHFSKSYSPVRRPIEKNTAQMSHSHAVKGNWGSAVKTSAGYNWRPTRPNSNCNGGPTFIRTDHPLKNMVDRGIFDSGCSGHMTGNKDQLEDFEEFNGGSMPDENQILLKVPRHYNMNSFDMKTRTPAKGFTCLIAKATSDESKLWHRRFSWVFFFASKDETSGILQNFIRQIENQLNHRVKIIRLDNGTEFKNRDMLEFCGNKGIKQEYSNARTPQQNGVAERMNRTLIEAARTMLADSLLPTTFCAEAISTTCYIFNRVIVTKPQNKTPYELLFGHKLIISYIRPFGCHVTILDTLSVLGKFDGKSDEGFLVGYSLNSKAYRVYNLVTKRVEVNLHVNFLEDKPNVKGVGYRWMFDIDYLTDSMNYIPVSLENQANPHAGASEVSNSAGTSQTPNFNASEEKDEDVELIVVPSAVKNTEEKVESRTSSTNSKKEEILTEPQQEKEDSSTDEPVNTGELDPDDSAMPEPKIFHKLRQEFLMRASYDDGIKSVDKGKRYKRRKSSKAFAGTGLDFEEVKSAFEKVNTGGRRVSVPGGRRVSVPSPDRALEKEEVAKQVHLDSLIAQRMAEEQELTEEQKKRKAQVQFEAQSYTEEDWDTIRAMLEANAELKESVLGKDLTVEDYAKRMVELVNQRRKHFAEERARAKRNSLDSPNSGNLYVKLFEESGDIEVDSIEKLLFERNKDDKPTKKTGKRRKQIARKGFHTDHDRDESEDSDEANEKDDSTSGTKIPIKSVPVSYKIPSIAITRSLSKDTESYIGLSEETGQQRIICWRYYDACRVHCLNLESTDVYMLIERKYPLSAEVCKAMLDKKLQGGKPDEDCYKILKMMEKQAGIRK
ncbi:ribonuclease H-like domain-containing protein [Tanacetum coccineum]